MQFRNLTPFDARCFTALDPDDKEHRVIAMKVGYRLTPLDSQSGRLLALLMDKDPPSLCMGDVFYDEKEAGSLREESDLAPYKPKCDVLVRGHAHAPGARAAKRWKAGIRITAPCAAQSLSPDRSQPDQRSDPARENGADRQCNVLLNKALQFTGPRQFRRDPLRLWHGWRLGAPLPATKVPLRWEHAFGGSSVVANPAHVHDPQAPMYLLNAVCFSNPVGCGWIEQRFSRLAGKAGMEWPWRWPAPQIEYLSQPIRKPAIVKAPSKELQAFEMAMQAESYPYQPAGFGALGRAWAPRLALAGSYDETWQKQRWPNLPHDFDFGYWNGAPADQQTPYLPSGARIELLNLVDPRHAPQGWATADLPAHRPFVLLRMTNGALVPWPMFTDTVIVDTDAMTLTLTHRTSIPQGTSARVAEARFETDPAAPLLKIAPQPAGVPKGA
jgi:hypothetical protein